MATDAPRRVIVDTDTAGDDAQALLMAATSDRIELEGVTICAGNVEFEHQVENAKYALELVGAAETVTVHEGAREPLVKDYTHAEYVHGEGGLGGELFPDTGIDSGDQHAVEYIVETARDNPGEITLACIAPLTNVAMALRQEPALGELLDEVWVMGGNVNCLGNVTPAAEYNFWVDPEAAKMVLGELDVTLFDWGLTERDTTLDADTLAAIDAGPDAPIADFYRTVTASVREYNQEKMGADVVTHPDSALVAGLVEPALIEAAAAYYVDVDERAGLTRGYTAVDEDGVTDGDPRTTVVESIDADLFETMIRDLLFEGQPETSLD